MSAGDREAEAQAKKGDEAASNDRDSRAAAALKQYWCVGLRALELIIAVIAIGLIVGALYSPQVVQSDHRHIAVIYSAYSNPCSESGWDVYFYKRTHDTGENPVKNSGRNPSEYCLCETGIDPKKFKQCVASGGSMASWAAAKFFQLGIDTTPIVEIGPKSTVFAVDDSWYLKKICTIFGENQPRGCLKPFDCNQSEVYPEKKALAQFDKVCDCGYNYCGTQATPTTTMEPTMSAMYDRSY